MRKLCLYKGFKCIFNQTLKNNLQLLYMSHDRALRDFASGEDDVVKPIKHISSQKILEKLELIEKNEELINKPKQVKNKWIKLVILTRIREAYMLID